MEQEAEVRPQVTLERQLQRLGHHEPLRVGALRWKTYKEHSSHSERSLCSKNFRLSKATFFFLTTNLCSPIKIVGFVFSRGEYPTL